MPNLFRTLPALLTNWPSRSILALMTLRPARTRWRIIERSNSAIARAKLLAEDPEKRILVLCYNRLLAQHLAVALAGHRRVTVRTFHRWAVRCGIDFREGEEDGAFGERLLVRLVMRSCAAATTRY